MSLHDIFQRLRADHPDLTDGAEPLGVGAFGIVVTHPDDQVTKFLFDYQQTPGMGYWSRYMFGREMKFFKAMEPIDTPGVDVPRLVGDATLLKGGRFMASYTMTRVAGQSEYWPPHAESNPQSYYTALGQLVGKLSRAFDRIDPKLRREFAAHYTDQIVPLPTLLDDATNKRLLKADALFQTLKTPGFIHGDFHWGNVMADRGRPAGVIDFAGVVRADNIYEDLARAIVLARIKEADHQAHMLAGYGEGTGTLPDPLLLKCSILAKVTVFARESEGRFPDAAGTIKTTLNETARLAYERRRAAEVMKAGPA